MLLFKMLRRGGGRAMDPLQVSMTGVRMGERFLQVGCHDRALLSGLAAKVGLSGAAAVATHDTASAKRAAAVGAKVGALIDVRPIEGSALPFESDQFDMIVIDDTNGSFAAEDEPVRVAWLRDALRTVRQGGRIEVVEGLGGNLLQFRGRKFHSFATNRVFRLRNRFSNKCQEAKAKANVAAETTRTAPSI